MLLYLLCGNSGQLARGVTFIIIIIIIKLTLMAVQGTTQMFCVYVS